MIYAANRDLFLVERIRINGFFNCENNLKGRGYIVTTFETIAEAVKYLDMQIDNSTVGFGGSVTLEQMKLLETLL